MPYNTTIVSENLQEVRARIAEAALRAGRSPKDVQLVAVSKMFPVEAVVAAWMAGQCDFGENRPEEGEHKIPQVTAALFDAHPTWHMIGHIQSRKARMVIEHFDHVHSIDRNSIAEKLSRLAVEAEQTLPVLLECNVSGEASKYGYDANHWSADDAAREALFDEIAAVVELPGLRVEGLMTMAPLVDDAEAVRPVFAGLRALRDALQERFPETSWEHLSMGMTNDFEVAIEEGATLVRIGRAIFGPREEH